MHARVPYSQSASHPDPQGKLYRTDCSGFVSMAWNLTSSLSTRTLHTVSDRLGSYDQMRTGDIFLAYDSHVRYFVNWKNASHTTAIVLEQTTGGAGNTT